MPQEYVFESWHHQPELPIEHADILVVDAHPDDAELTCAGSLIKAAAEGLRVAVLDLSQGEMGSRGTPELRRSEAMAASQIMGLCDRRNACLPDGSLRADDDAIRAVVTALRAYTPDVVIFNQSFERHPDHEAVHKIVRSANFFAGLTKYTTVYGAEEQKPHRPRRLLNFLQTYDFNPSFYVDVSDVYEQKLAAIACYGSQVAAAGAHTAGPVTFISRPEFMEFLEARSRLFGERIGTRHAEAFLSIESVGLRSLSSIL